MAAKTDHTLERLVFFSDAVFAIAITLLVIEIHVPGLPRTASDAEHWRELSRLIPSFAGYLISFAMVGAFWMSHHRAFALAGHYHWRVLGWNMALLATIAFMPFSTAYFSANLGQHVPTLVYCFILATAALLNTIIAWIVTAPPMVDPSASPKDIGNVRRRSLSLALGSATAVVLALLIRDIGVYALFGLPVFRILLARLDKFRSAKRAAS